MSQKKEEKKDKELTPEEYSRRRYRRIMPGPDSGGDGMSWSSYDKMMDDYESQFG